ncbi:MAG: GNAT family N-acetyltransferase [Cyclobacteriaceae bacterium]
MTFTSARLQFEKFRNSDWNDYLSWYSNDEVMRFLTGKGLSEEEARERFTKALETNAGHSAFGLFAVSLSYNQEFMGIGKLSLLSDTQAEIGYGSFPQHWGKGYATEMLERLIEHATCYAEIKELIAVVHPDNLLSKRILDRHNFQSFESRMDIYGPVEQYRLILRDA